MFEPLFRTWLLIKDLEFTKSPSRRGQDFALEKGNLSYSQPVKSYEVRRPEIFSSAILGPAQS